MTLNPLHWGTAPFAVLIVLCVALRLVIPPTTHRLVHLLREALVVFPAALFYFGVRGVAHADPSVAYAHAHRVVHFEQRVGLFHELWLQQHVLRADWIITLFNWIYIWGHWPVLIIGLLWLADFHRERYPLYRNAYLLSGIAGMTIFLIFPVAPPRFLTELGFVDTVTLHSHSYRVLQPQGLANLYAAMPSLHFGWNLLMGIAIWRESRHLAGKIFALLMPPAMFLAIVMTANHFIIDGLVGGTLVITSLAVVTVVPPRIARRRAARKYSGGEFSKVSNRPNTGTGVRADVAMDGNSSAAERNGHEETKASAGTTPPEQVNDEPKRTLFGRFQRPLLIAHRFGNDPRQVELAARAGADLIEADVWLHRGRLEVRHYKTLGPLPLRWDQWYIERASRPAPLLEELLDALDALDDDHDLLCDVKGRNPKIADALVEVMRRRRPGRTIIVSTQRWGILEHFRRFEDVQLIHSIGYPWQLRLAWRRLTPETHDAVSLQYRLLNAKAVSALKERVDTVITWPINDEVPLQRVLEWGVDGITSDSPDLLHRAASLRER